MKSLLIALVLFAIISCKEDIDPLNLTGIWDVVSFQTLDSFEIIDQYDIYTFAFDHMSKCDCGDLSVEAVDTTGEGGVTDHKFKIQGSQFILLLKDGVTQNGLPQHIQSRTPDTFVFEDLTFRYSLERR